MSAGYRTLHVGKNGALALAAITVLHGVAVPLCFCSSSVLFEGENFLHRLQLCYLDSEVLICVDVAWHQVESKTKPSLSPYYFSFREPAKDKQHFSVVVSWRQKIK